MFTGPENTVFTTGADRGDILVGIHTPENEGLLVEVYEKQTPGRDSRIRGHFKVLHEGTGRFSKGIRRVIDSNPYFGRTDDFIRLVSSQPDCDRCSDVLNANDLWKLGVEKLRSTVLNSNDAFFSQMDSKHCTSCGRTYSDESLNYCLYDGGPLEDIDEVETVITHKYDVIDRKVTPFRTKREGSASEHPGFEHIRSAVAAYPNLVLKTAHGSNHHIINEKQNGSIWARPRYRGMAVTATGAAGSKLFPVMDQMLGAHFTEDHKGYRYWQVDDPDKIKPIISAWAAL